MATLISKISWVKCFLGLKFRFIQQTIFHHKLEMISFPEYSFNIQEYNISKDRLYYTHSQQEESSSSYFLVVTVDQCSWCLFLLVSFFLYKRLVFSTSWNIKANATCSSVVSLLLMLRSSHWLIDFFCGRFFYLKKKYIYIKMFLFFIFSLAELNSPVINFQTPTRSASASLLLIIFFFFVQEEEEEVAGALLSSVVWHAI